jgi:hypothetical protein
LEALDVGDSVSGPGALLLSIGTVCYCEGVETVLDHRNLNIPERGNNAGLSKLNTGAGSSGHNPC